MSGSSMFGYSSGSSLNYYCMSCGTKHNQAACPKCGSKMKRVGSWDRKYICTNKNYYWYL